MTCKVCKENFTPAADHRGYVNVCLGCNGADVERVVGVYNVGGKSDYSVEVTTRDQYERLQGKSLRNR